MSSVSGSLPWTPLAWRRIFPRSMKASSWKIITLQGGGPVAQALVTLARLGSAAGLVGRIGDDEAGVRTFEQDWRGKA